VHPYRKFSLSLLASLALWYPTLQAKLNGGHTGVPEMCIRYLICFFVAKFLVGIMANLYDSYAEAVARSEAEKLRIEEEAATELAEEEAAARTEAALQTMFGKE
jgi:hypothetical protein